MHPRTLIATLALLLAACDDDGGPAEEDRMASCAEAVERAYELGCDQTNADYAACLEVNGEDTLDCQAEEKARLDCLEPFERDDGVTGPYAAAHVTGLQPDDDAVDKCLENWTGL